MGVSNKTWVDNTAPTCNADDLNGMNLEVNNAIEDSGQTLSYTDRTQLSKAVWNYWQANVTYILGSIVRKTATSELYVSLVNNNLNNALPSRIDDSNWKFLFDLNSNSGLSTDSITAYSGGGQTNATQLNRGINRISTCAAIGDSVKLPSVFYAGEKVVVINDGVAACDVFPASSDTIDNLSANTAFRVGISSRITFVAITSNSAWRIENVQNELVTDTITAYSGGGQANATQLYRGTNIITVCAARLDSVKLPASFNVGDIVIVTNNGAKTANIYPASGDGINALADDTAVMLLPSNTMVFIGSVANDTWKTLSNQKQVSPEIDVSSAVFVGIGSVSSCTCKIKISLDSEGVFRIEDGYIVLVPNNSNANHTFGITGLTPAKITQYFNGGSTGLTTTIIYSVVQQTNYPFQYLLGAATDSLFGNLDNIRLESQTLI